MKSVSALKVGCGKFFHGAGVIHLLPREILRLGGKAFILGGPTSMKLFLQTAAADLKKAGVTYFSRIHTEHCTAAWAAQYASLVRQENCTVLIGVGGGKCLDLMKCVSTLTGLPIITIPTSIATCAATSMVCIMYNEKGQRAPAVKLEKEVDVCIADTDLIASAPPRTLAAGILDSMAKMPECFHQKDISSYRDCPFTEYMQTINSRAIYDFLSGEARELYFKGRASSRFEDAILIHLLCTSIVSGFADGSGQLALAHATYDFMRNHNTENSCRFLHGEIVGTGLLIQMIYNRMEQQAIEHYKALLHDLDSPCSLKEIGYPCSPEKIDFFVKTIALDANVPQGELMERLRSAVALAL